MAIAGPERARIYNPRRDLHAHLGAFDCWLDPTFPYQTATPQHNCKNKYLEEEQTATPTATAGAESATSFGGCCGCGRRCCGSCCTCRGQKRLPNQRCCGCCGLPGGYDGDRAWGRIRPDSNPPCKAATQRWPGYFAGRWTAANWRTAPRSLPAGRDGLRVVSRRTALAGRRQRDAGRAVDGEPGADRARRSAPRQQRARWSARRRASARRCAGARRPAPL
jgi:hypothetical protein